MQEAGYCKQHDPELVAAKYEQKKIAWEVEWANKKLAAERQSRILKACEGLTAEQVEQAIKSFLAAEQVREDAVDERNSLDCFDSEWAFRNL